MSTMMIMRWDGVTPDQYEQVRKLANWEGDHPKGGLFHVASFGNNALRVTDIWESEEEFNSFVQSRLMPAVIQTGIQSQPQVEMFPVHAIFNPSPDKLS